MLSEVDILYLRSFEHELVSQTQGLEHSEYNYLQQWRLRIILFAIPRPSQFLELVLSPTAVAAFLTTAGERR